MNKSPTKDKNNLLYTPQHQIHLCGQQKTGTVLCMSSVLCQRGSQGVPAATAQAASAYYLPQEAAYCLCRGKIISQVITESVFHWHRLSDPLGSTSDQVFFQTFFKENQVVILRNLCFSFDMLEVEWHINEPKIWPHIGEEPSLNQECWVCRTLNLWEGIAGKKTSDFNYSLLQEISGWMDMKLWLGHGTADPCLGREALGEHFQDICLLGWVRGLQGWGALH